MQQQQKERQKALTDKNLANRCVEICQEHKAENILLYDVTGLSLLTDYYLLCTGTSEPHIRAISKYFNKELGDEGIKPAHVDGTSASNWIVIDYGSVLIHIMTREIREYYNIEDLFEDDRIAYSSTDTDAE